MVETTHYCKDCKTTKPVSDFHKVAQRYCQSWCKKCQLVRTKAFNKANPESRARTDRKCQLKRKYGITPEEYAALLLMQRGSCAICEKPQSAFAKRLAVDHCHVTKRVRGLLCPECNTAIGKFYDDPAVMRKAAKYVEDH